MNPDDYTERELELANWPVRLISYKLGESWFCKVDNVSPGAQIARSISSTRADAESLALRKAERRLAATRRLPVA
jgi:hypothetical protein